MFCRHSESNSGSPKDIVSGSLHPNSASWVIGHYPSIGSTIRTCGTSYWKSTGSRAAVAWLLPIKLPVVKNAARYDFLFEATMIDKPFTPYDDTKTNDYYITSIGWMRNKHDSGNYWRPSSPVGLVNYWGVAVGQWSTIEFSKCGIDTTIGNQWTEQFCVYSYGSCVKVASGGAVDWHAGDASITKIAAIVTMN